MSWALGLGPIAAACVAHADALPTPSLTAPLAANPDPAAFDLGPVGKLYVAGQASGLGMTQTRPSASPYSGNGASTLGVSNAQIELQTTTGPVQFYGQLGAYSTPAVGVPYLPAGRTTTETFGPAPIGSLKLVPNADVSVQIGAPPTLLVRPPLRSDPSLDASAAPQRLNFWNLRRLGIRLSAPRRRFLSSS